MNEDKIIQKLIELDQKVDNLATKKDVHSLDEKVVSSLDEQLVILQRPDQERLLLLKELSGLRPM